MSWFNRTPKPPKHEHEWKTIGLEQWGHWSAHTSQYDRNEFVKYVRQCRTCSHKEFGEKRGMSVDMYKLVYGPLEAPNP
jgi:hypothetical protein